MGTVRCSKTAAGDIGGTVKRGDGGEGSGRKGVAVVCVREGLDVQERVGEA